ncbi:hypothetical protein [Acrocarpospora sp. B8E8]|uniref:hypothetical protein n=1 Tax=Acrocarpospora sp. B8E8 TaxID=3153572 RepID=UPI00325D6794
MRGEVQDPRAHGPVAYRRLARGSALQRRHAQQAADVVRLDARPAQPRQPALQMKPENLR